MDTTRYEALTAKRDEQGLTDEEADELGKMVAELEGRAYENAETLHSEEQVASSEPEGASGAACGHLGCGCLTSESFCSDFCRTHAGESSDAGPEFDCGCGHDACKAVVGEA
jgi:hypothetical protein